MSRNRGLWRQGHAETHGPIEPIQKPEARDAVSALIWAVVGIALAAMILL